MAIKKQEFYEGAALHLLARSGGISNIRYETPFFLRSFAALREKAGLSQKELARRLKTSQQQISRLESPDHEGHSLANLRRVAEALHARVRVVFESDGKSVKRVARPTASYRVKRASAK